MAEKILKWDEVLEEPSFLKLSPLEKDMAQTQYFNDVVKPQVPQQDWGIAEQQFFNDFPSAIMQKAQGIGSTAMPQSLTSDVDLQKLKGVSTLGYTGKKFGQKPEEFPEAFDQLMQPVSKSVGMGEKEPFVESGADTAQGFYDNYLRGLANTARGMVDIIPMLAQIPIGIAKNVFFEPIGKLVEGKSGEIDTTLKGNPLSKEITGFADWIKASFSPATKPDGTDDWTPVLQNIFQNPEQYALAYDMGKGTVRGVKKFNEYLKNKPAEGWIPADKALKTPEPIKSPAEQTIEAEQVKMREAQAQGLTREQQLEETQVNAIKTGEATEILLNGKSIKNHVLEGVESGLKPEVIENNIRELLTIQYAKEPNPLKQIEVLKAQKQLNKDISNAFEEVISSEGKGQKGYAKDAEGQMQDVVSSQEPSVPLEAQKQAAPPLKPSQLDLAGAKTGLEGKLPSEELKAPTALEQATEDAKTREAQMPQKAYDISPFTEVYKEPLGGEGGYVRIAKDTPDLNIQAIKNMDIKPAEQMLTTLHVADRHPFMKAPIETAIKAVQDTNHIITQRLQNLTDIFDKAEGKPLWGLIRRRSSNIRELDLMVEGKVKTPPQLQEFVTGVKSFLEEQRQRVIERKKQDIESHMSPNQQTYLKYLKEGGEEPRITIAEFQYTNKKGKTITVPEHSVAMNKHTKLAVEETLESLKKTEGWGKTDYFPRLMKGSYYFIGENGKILAIGETPKQAKYNLMERLESDPSLKGTRVYFTNGLKNMLNARHTLNPELRGTLEQLGTALSRKQFFNLINKTEKLIDAEIKEAGIGEIEGVKVDMRGIAKMQSREKFAGNLMKRNTEMRGQEADPFKTLSAYTSAIERHLGLSNAKKALIDFEEKLPPNMENAKIYIKKLRENILGHYDWANKFTDQVIGGKIGAKPFLLSRVLQKGQGLVANLKLGFAPVKALLNYTDATLSTLTKTGAKHWVNGIRLLSTKEGKALINEIGHLGGMEESFAYSYKTTPETVNILKPMGLYQFVELKGRSQSIAAAYSQGLEKYSGDVAKAKQHAVDIDRITQGLYDVAARPVAIRNPLTSTAYQFKQFINNKIRFLASLSPQQIAFYAPSIIALYGTRGLWLTMKSIVGITLISDLLGNAGEKANEDMNKNYPRLHRGLFGLVGYDVSAPGTVQLPTQVKDWMGVTYNDTIKTGEMIIKGMKNNGWTDEEIAQYINQIAPVGYNIYKGLQLAKSGEIKQGEKLIYRGKPLESVYNFLGAKTVEQSKEQDTARYENELKKRQKEKMAVITDKILSSKTQEELNKNIQDAIKTKGIMTQDEFKSFVDGLVKTWEANQLTARERTFQGLPKNIKREEFINELQNIPQRQE